MQEKIRNQCSAKWNRKKSWAAHKFVPAGCHGKFLKITWNENFPTFFKTAENCERWIYVACTICSLLLMVAMVIITILWPSSFQQNWARVNKFYSINHFLEDRKVSHFILDRSFSILKKSICWTHLKSSSFVYYKVRI